MLLAWMAAVSFVLAVPSASPASAASANAETVLEQQFLVQINAERAARGLAPMTNDPNLVAASRRWSDTMGSSNSLYHSSDGRAEIVGYGGRSGQITDAFMNSPGHRNLIVDPNLRFAGAGVTCDSTGRLWVTVQFRRLDTRQSTLSSSSANPSVTPANAGSSCSDSPHIGSVRRLYRAFFRRESDQSGLNYWIGQADKGVELSEIADHFAGSDEFRRTYGSLSNRDFVNRVYWNVLGRGADRAGYDYWVGQLNSGMTRGEMMVGFSQSIEYITRVGIA